MNGRFKPVAIFIAIVLGILAFLTKQPVFFFLLFAGFVLYGSYQKKHQTFTIHHDTMSTYDPLEKISTAGTAILRGAKRAGIIFLIVLVAVILLANMVVVIPAGETGVYHLFGKVRDAEVHSGIHLINPLASIERMSIRTEQYTMSVTTNEGQRMGDDSIEALTKEGLKVNLDITVLYHLNEDQASDVYRELGPRFEDKVLRPEVRSAIREVIATYEAKDIYSDKRDEAVQAIEDRLRSNIEPRGIVIESVLLRNVALPAMLTQAIESKLTAEQEAQRYDFVLQREEKEAERKRIEAAGQRDAQSIINQSLTDRYLQYLYIQNLENREGTIYVPYDLPLLRGI